VSGEVAPNEGLNGQAFIYSTTTAAWLEISPPGLGSTDARYVNLTGDTMTGPLYLPAAAPANDTEAANKKYVDDRVATGPSALPATNVVITNPGNGITGTGLDSAIFQLASGKVAKAGDSMSGSLTMTNGATVTGLPQPNNNNDAAHKAYVDGHRFSLDGLTDVTISSPATNQVVKYDGTKWVNGAAPGGTGDAVTITAAGNIAATNVQAALYELDNEKLALAGGTMTGAIAMSNNKITGLGAPQAGSQDAATALYVDNSVSNRQYALNDLSNVTVPSPADGDILKWSSGSGQWVSSNTGPGSAASSVSIPASGNISNTNVQGAIY
jgi:hypothetical protein